MKVKDVVALVEKHFYDRPTDTILGPDREVLKGLLGLVVDEALESEQLQRFFQKPINIVTTIESKSEYELPGDFGENFVKVGRSFVCRCQFESEPRYELDYVPVATFYLQQSTTNGRPSQYSVHQQRLLLNPPPNDEYYISGLYVPTSIDLSDEEVVIDLPSSYLVYGTLHKAQPENGGYMVSFIDARKKLLIKEARNTMPTIAPILEDYYESKRFLSW